VGWTVLEDVQKVPALPALTLKGADGRIDRVLGQKPAGSLVVEDGMATAQFRQGFAHPAFEFLNVHVEQGRRSLVKPLGPLAVFTPPTLKCSLRTRSLTEAKISPRNFGLRDVSVMLVSVMMSYGQVGGALQCVPRPVIRYRRGAVLPQHVALRRSKRRRSRFMCRQVLVELLHQEERKSVVNRPEGRDYAPSAASRNAPEKRRNTLLSLKWATAVSQAERSRGRNSATVNDFRSLQKAVFPAGGSFNKTKADDFAPLCWHNRGQLDG